MEGICFAAIQFPGPSLATTYFFVPSSSVTSNDDFTSGIISNSGQSGTTLMNSGSPSIQPGNPTSGFSDSMSDIFATSPGVSTTTFSGVSNPSVTSSNTNTINSSPNIGAIVGGVVGGLVLLALIAVLAYILIQRRKRRNHVAPSTLFMRSVGAYQDRNASIPGPVAAPASYTSHSFAISRKPVDYGSDDVSRLTDTLPGGPQGHDT